MSPDDQLVSIIIPVYRGFPFVREAIETALSQTWPWIEVIVVDDGSDDNGATRGIVQSFGNRVRYIYKENGGVASALNAGIDAMEGRYFSWLSHDDRYHPRKVELQMVAAVKEERPTIIFSNYDVIREDGTTEFRVCIGNGYDREKPIWAVLEGRLNGCAMLIPKECFDVCGRFDPGLPTTQDYRLWFEMARRFPFVHVDHSVVQHRRHPAQGSLTPRHIEEVNLLWRYMLATLSVDEMERAAGSELAFAVRNLEELRGGARHGARLFAESQFRGSAREHEIAVIWADSGSSVGPAHIISAIEQIGPRVTEVVIIDSTRSAERSVQLRELPSLRPQRIVHQLLGGPVETLLALADSITSDTVVLASAGLKFSPGQMQRSFERIWSGAARAILRRDPRPDDKQNVWPPALLGAVMSKSALADLAAATKGAGWPSALSVVARPLPALSIDVAAPGAKPEPAKPVAGGLSRRPSDRGTLLIILHDLGGGTAIYAERIAALARRRRNVLFMWGSGDRIAISASGARQAELKFKLPTGLDDALAALAEWNIERVDVMHSIGLEDHLDTILDRLGVPYDVTLLDYYTIAQNPHLTDDSGYIGDRTAGDPDNAIWRPEPMSYLRKAERLIAPSRHTASVFARIVPDLPVIAARVPEPDRPELFSPIPVLPRDDEDMRVLIVGRVGHNKGSDILLEVARMASEQAPGISFHAIGKISADLELPLPDNLHLHGQFDGQELNQLVCLLGPHLAWLPFVLPETYSFAVSDVMLQGLPLLTNGIGAIAERLDKRPYSWVLDPADATAEGYLHWLRKLKRERLQTAPRWCGPNRLPPATADFYQKDYLVGTGRPHEARIAAG